jgi:two-component SAPR family response regulator
VPKNVLGILFYVKACLLNGLFYHAYVAVRRSLDNNPNDYRVLITMAKVLKAIGHTKEVNKHLDRAKETVPDFIYMPKDTLYQIIEDIRV